MNQLTVQIQELQEHINALSDALDFGDLEKFQDISRSKPTMTLSEFFQHASPQLQSAFWYTEFV